MLPEITPTVATVGEVITLTQAIAWTGTYQAEHAEGLRSVYFSADVFTDLLAASGAKGIRIYNANNGTNDCFVLVAATEDTDLTGSEYKLYDKGTGCPGSCPVNSPLNH